MHSTNTVRDDFRASTSKSKDARGNSARFGPILDRVREIARSRSIKLSIEKCSFSKKNLGPQAAAHPSDSISACSNTVCVAFSCLSGGYPCYLRIRFHENAQVGADVLSNGPGDGDMGVHHRD